VAANAVLTARDPLRTASPAPRQVRRRERDGADGYHCPYCNGQSVDGSWTVAQLAAIEDETRYYAEKQTLEMFKGMERQSNDFVTIKGRRSSESTEPSAANGAG
jgi:hypothetical protein